MSIGILNFTFLREGGTPADTGQELRSSRRTAWSASMRPGHGFILLQGAQRFAYKKGRQLGVVTKRR